MLILIANLLMDDVVHICRLVMHQAAKVRNERATVQKDYYVLVFFIQGKEASI